MARRRQTGAVGVEVRTAAEADVPAMARLGAALARWHHEMDPDRFMAPEPLEPGYAWWLGKEVVNPRAVVVAAVRRVRGRDRVLGYSYGRLEGRDWNTLRDACGVGVDLVVDEAARGRGIGRLLVDAMVARLAEKGAPRVVIDVAARNRRAQRFFESIGFRRTMIEMVREVPPGLAPPRPRRRAAARRAAPRSSRSRRGVGS